MFDHATLTCVSLADAIPRVLDLVTTEGREAYVRDELNLEVLGADIEITDPHDRLPLVPGRRPITAFCLMEYLWYAAQRTDLEPLEVYAPNISFFYGGLRSVLGSDYGRQLFGARSGGSQWERIIELLRHDQGSKRAFMAVFAPGEMTTLLPTNLDISCTVGFQVLVRGGKLHWVTSMRANDAYRGFVSDTFSFTMFHELLAATLDIPLGHYLHRPTSLHTFPEDQATIARIIAQWRTDTSAPVAAARMPRIDPAKFWQNLTTFWDIHDQARLTDNWSLLASVADLSDTWWRWASGALLDHHADTGAST